MAKQISRRSFLKTGAISLGTLAVGARGAFASPPPAIPVFFTKDLSSNGLLHIYSTVMQGRRLPGRVAVKLHSGEPGGHNYPAPDLIRALVQSVNGAPSWSAIRRIPANASRRKSTGRR